MSASPMAFASMSARRCSPRRCPAPVQGTAYLGERPAPPQNADHIAHRRAGRRGDERAAGGTGRGWAYAPDRTGPRRNLHLSCSNARLSAPPAPSGITSECRAALCPVRGNELTRALARSPSCRFSRNLSRMASDRNMTALIDAPRPERHIMVAEYGLFIGSRSRPAPAGCGSRALRPADPSDSLFSLVTEYTAVTAYPFHFKAAALPATPTALSPDSTGSANDTAS